MTVFHRVKVSLGRRSPASTRQRHLHHRRRSHQRGRAV